MEVQSGLVLPQGDKVDLGTNRDKLKQIDFDLMLHLVCSQVHLNGVLIRLSTFQEGLPMEEALLPVFKKLQFHTLVFLDILPLFLTFEFPRGPS